MRNLEIFVAPTEFKFVGDAQSGAFSGYGAVFNNLDSHKDIISPGAFTDSLARHEAKGTLPGLYVEHSAFTGGDPLPVGVWTKMAQDQHGLRVEGKISALDTDHGRRIRSLMQDGALGGLSIAYQVPDGGAQMGKKQGEPRRTLTALNLHAVDIVRDPSNSAARIQELKSSFSRHLKVAAGGSNDPENDGDNENFEPDIEKAIEAICAAMDVQDKSMSGSSLMSNNSSKADAVLMNHIQNAHEALTGDRVPSGMTGWTKSAFTIREFQAWLREKIGLSHARSSELAKLWTDSLPRDEGSNQARPVSKKAALDELSSNLADFSLPKF